MLSWVAPWWFGGLALLPLIRWLHRGGRHRRALRVPRLALWQGVPAQSAAAGELAPPDPAWRRRALLAALLCLALAGPQWPQPQPAITLWIDDSPSMLVREAPDRGSTRLVEGLALARAQLADVAHAEVTVRTLSDPWRERGEPDDALASDVAAGAGRRGAAPPPAALLRSDRLHWLLTDGADATLLAWADGRRPDRVIHVGRSSRNVGLTHLSARRRADDPQRIDVLLRLGNGGDTAESRELVLTDGKGELGRWVQRLEPGASLLLEASIGAPSTLSKVRATLQPGDALVADDMLELDLAPLRQRRVSIDTQCPQALAAAVRAHPGLAAVPADAADADALLDCGSAGSDRPLPTLRAAAQRLPVRPTGPATWSSSLAESRRVRLDGDIRLAAPLQRRADDDVLLAFGDEAAILVHQATPRRVQTSIDFAAMAAGGGPATPLLVNLMFEQLFDAPLLDAVAQIERRATAVRIAPTRDVEALAVAPRADTAATQHDLTRPLLIAAWLLLASEVVALVLQARRLRDTTGTGSA